MVTRISGLASGMDIDSMVSQLMKAERAPLDKMKQDQQTQQWQIADYRDLNSKLLDLHNSSFNMKLQSTYLAKTVASTDESSISATAGASAINGTYKIQVSQLAQTASLTSSSNIGVGDFKAKLSAAGLSANTSLTISGSKGTATINVNTTDSISDFMSNINNQTKVTGVRAMYDDKLDRIFFTSVDTGAASKIDLQSEDASLISNVLHLTGSSTATTERQIVSGSKSFASGLTNIIDSTKVTGSIADQTLRVSYDGKVYDFTINKSTTIGSLISNINGSDLGKAGVSAYLDNSGKLAFSNPDDNKSLGFQEVRDASQPEDDIKILQLLGFNDSAGLDTTTVVSNLPYTHLGSNGVDAKVKFNGVDASYSSNSFTISGITFTAKKLQTTDLDVTVGTNVDNVYNSIKAFVDKYNDTISTINSKISEQKNRDYPPLTDEQRKTMSADDIKLWEEKAKKGMLANDTILDGSLYTLRNAWSNPVSSIPSSDLKQLAQIGITTGTYTDQGKLIIDENKLRQAISDNPDQVSALFTTDDGIASSESGDGLAVRIYNQTDSIMKQIKDKAGTDTSGIGDFTLGKSLQDLNKRIDDFNTRMQAVEDHYYTQFGAMEKFISQMNQQSNWLTQQLGGASGG